VLEVLDGHEGIWRLEDRGAEVEARPVNSRDVWPALEALFQSP